MAMTYLSPGLIEQSQAKSITCAGERNLARELRHLKGHRKGIGWVKSKGNRNA
jgi:hypothetical protein